jgi:hypothetical protein
MKPMPVALFDFL